MWDLIDKIIKYFIFDKKEIKSLIAASLVLGFIFAFKDFTIVNFIFAIVIVAVSLIFHISAQKITALHLGFGAEFRIWWLGLLISLIIAFISNGKLWWIVIPGGIIFSMIAKHRLGKFRYGMNYWPMGIIGFTGPIASIILGTIFKNIEIYMIGSPVPFLHNIFIFNLAFAACQMLPIPPLDGHFMFYASRSWYAFLSSTIIIYTVLVLILHIYSWVWALILGGIAWLIYYIYFEKEAW